MRAEAQDIAENVQADAEADEPTFDLSKILSNPAVWAERLAENRPPDLLRRLKLFEKNQFIREEERQYERRIEDFKQEIVSEILALTSDDKYPQFDEPGVDVIARQGLVQMLSRIVNTALIKSGLK